MSTLVIEKFETSLKVQRTKGKFSHNPCQNILELYNVLLEVRFAISKTNLDI